MTLYDITGEWLSLLEMAEDPDTDAQALADTLEGLNYELEEKADGYAMVLAQMEHDIEGLRKLEDRCAAKKKVLENRMKYLKNSLMGSMEILDKPKFKTGKFSFSLRDSQPRVVLDVEPSELPLEFLRQKNPEPDKKALGDYLKGCDGERFPFAHLERSKTLVIR